MRSRPGSRPTPRSPPRRRPSTQARLNLSFTHIVSPVDGVAGLVQAQIGDLVGPGTGVLTTVSNLDPIKAYFPISEQAYLEFRGRDANAPSIPAGISFDLILADGSTYPSKGTFYAIDSQVDGNTGTLRVVAVFPNPNALLRPGQYARVRATVSVEKGALLVPQRALTELQGSYQVATVDRDNRAHLLTVKVGPADRAAVRWSSPDSTRATVWSPRGSRRSRTARR